MSERAMTPCARCQGACCESILIDARNALVDPEWAKVRGIGLVTLPGGARALEIEAPCPQLKGGACSIYDTRPEVCRNYEVMALPCRFAVSRRRPLVFGPAYVFGEEN